MICRRKAAVVLPNVAEGLRFECDQYVLHVLGGIFAVSAVEPQGVRKPHSPLPALFFACNRQAHSLSFKEVNFRRPKLDKIDSS